MSIVLFMFNELRDFANAIWSNIGENWEDIDSDWDS